MATRRLTRVTWPDGHETMERLFGEQLMGSACFYCSLSDGVLKPVARSKALPICAHDECLPTRKEAA
jgi:hypothetical protein